MNSDEAEVIGAGPFDTWLDAMRESLRGDGGTNVPCGDCRGCCVSSYFIPIRPTDAAAAHISPELRVRAPGQPAGHTMMGYRADGTCPMLVNRQCTIYPYRPQTCRDYDCRIFAAAGIDAGGPEKIVINRRVRAWRFTYATDTAERTHHAIRATASFIRHHAAEFPNGRAPTSPTGVAVLAVKSYGVFLDPAVGALSDREKANAIVVASRAFDTPEHEPPTRALF
jgi:Fe-S-cluster containining protein